MHKVISIIKKFAFPSVRLSSSKTKIEKRYPYTKIEIR